MILTLFHNQKGIIHGTDPKRISCAKKGILKIGKTEILLNPEEESIVPMLYHGATGDYEAYFITENDIIYQLEKISVRGGWIQAPHPMTVELMELRYRMDQAEDKISKLEHIFDTNSLNFLIQ